MERLFKILRIKFDRFEQEPPDGAFDNIMSSLMEDQSKRRAFGGNGFLLFSSLIAVTTLAGTFVLNKNKIGVDIFESKKYSIALHQKNSTKEATKINRPLAQKINDANYGANLLSFKVGPLKYIPFSEENFNDQKYGGAYNGTETAYLVNNGYEKEITSINLSSNLIALNKNTQELIDQKKESRSTTKRYKNSKKALIKKKSRRHKRNKADKKVYTKKYSGDKSFVVKDPLSVYGQSKTKHFIDSIKLAEIEGDKKKEVKVELPNMVETPAIQAKYIPAPSRLTLSFLADKYFYISPINHPLVNTKNYQLKNYSEIGTASHQSVRFGYNIHKNLEISSGLAHYSIKSQFEADRINDSIQVSLVEKINEVEESVEYEEVIERKKLFYNGKTKLHYFSVPVEILFKSRLGKIRTFTGIGLNANFLVHNEQKISTKFKNNNEEINERDNKSLDDFSRLTFTVNPSIGILYPLNNQIDLRIGAGAAYNLSNIYASNDLKSNPFLIGANVGLRFKLD